MNFSKEVSAVLSHYHPLKIIIARDLYREKLGFVPEVTFYKILERLEKAGQISKIAKGVFCIPQKSKYGIARSSEKEIIHHFISSNSGMVVGYQVFNHLGLTTQIPRKVEVYSNKTGEQTRNLNNVSVKNINIKFTEENKKAILLLEILEHFYEIEDLNIHQFKNVTETLLKPYNESVFNYVLNSIKYKKRTIAFLESLLDFEHIENNMKQHLSATSTYRIPNVANLYEITSI